MAKIRYEIVRENSKYNKYIKWFLKCYREDGSLLSSGGYKTKSEAERVIETHKRPLKFGDKTIEAIYEVI
jgi:hypothetical protein